MDEFAEWIKKKYPKNRSGQSAAEIADDFPFTCEAWQESAKQCKLTHDDIFEIGRADGVAGERRRTEKILDSESYHAINAQAFMMRVKDRIEKDSN